MANPAKQKGDGAERELAGLLTDLLGVPVRRKLGAGRTDDTGDLDGLDLTVQVKNYRDVGRAIRDGLPQLREQVGNAGTPAGALLVRRRGGEWVAVMPLDYFATIIRETM